MIFWGTRGTQTNSVRKSVYWCIHLLFVGQLGVALLEQISVAFVGQTLTKYREMLKVYLYNAICLC